MRNILHRPSVATGALVGGLLTAPLLAILYLAERLAGLPFAPFDLFDWLARVLPGGLLTFGIDLLVNIVTALNLGPTDSTAKSAEQIMAVLLFLVIGILAGAVFFALLRAGEARTSPDSETFRNRSWLFGLLLGLIIALPFLLIGGAVNVTATASPALSVAWTLIAFLAWGAAVSWAYEQLSHTVETADDTADEALPVTVQKVNRRQFLVRLGGATAAITVVGAGLGALLDGNEGETVGTAIDAGEAALTPSPDRPLPNADDPLMPAPGTRPEYTPLDDHYRIDINIGRYPELDGEAWYLPIFGLVETPLDLTLDDLRNNYEPTDQYVTLSCISNDIGGDLISTTRWTGVSLQDILADVELLEEGTHLKITSEDGFFEIVSIDLIQSDERVMLAYAWDGEPLRAKHGFPLRTYIPDRYGMKQPKWITGIEVIAEWEPGYWVTRGWDEVARVRATSVIDTVASEATQTDADGNVLVPIGGIAYAGARGISRVEVQVDEGEWFEAQVRSPLSETTWVIWRYDWPFQEGQHRFAVRCVDGDGTPQIEERQNRRPSGATGIHTTSASL